jgi:hypothetical protein
VLSVVAVNRLDGHANLDVAAELDPGAEELTTAVGGAAAESPRSKAPRRLGLLMRECSKRRRRSSAGQDFEGPAPRALCAHGLGEGIKLVRCHNSYSSSSACGGGVNRLTQVATPLGPTIHVPPL